MRSCRGISQDPSCGSSFPRLPCSQESFHLLLHLQDMQFSHPLLSSHPLHYKSLLFFSQACPVGDTDIFQFSFPVLRCSNGADTEARSWFKLFYWRKWEVKIDCIKNLVKGFMKIIQGWESMITVASSIHQSSHMYNCLYRKCIAFCMARETPFSPSFGENHQNKHWIIVNLI